MTHETALGRLEQESRERRQVLTFTFNPDRYEAWTVSASFIPTSKDGVPTRIYGSTMEEAAEAALAVGFEAHS